MLILQVLGYAGSGYLFQCWVLHVYRKDIER
jgi:hypothetical protein